MSRDGRRPADRDDLSMWIAGNPAHVLADNFGRPASLFEKFPRDRVFIAPTEASSHGAREIEQVGRVSWPARPVAHLRRPGVATRRRPRHQPTGGTDHAA